MRVSGLYENIFADRSPSFQSLPLGSALLRTEILTEPGGARVQVDTYSNPYKGNFSLRTYLTQAERRAQLVPYNPLLPSSSVSKPASAVRKGAAVDPTAEKRTPSTTDQRSIPRPDRDSRAPNPVGSGDGAEFGKERRVGGPGASFLAELRSFFMRPAGVVTFGILFVALWASFRHKRA